MISTGKYPTQFPQHQGPECDYGFKLIIIGDAGAGHKNLRHDLPKYQHPRHLRLFGQAKVASCISSWRGSSESSRPTRREEPKKESDSKTVRPCKTQEIYEISRCHFSSNFPFAELQSHFSVFLVGLQRHRLAWSLAPRSSPWEIAKSSCSPRLRATKMHSLQLKTAPLDWCSEKLERLSSSIS